MSAFNTRTQDQILAEKHAIFLEGKYVEVGAENPDIVLLRDFVSYLRGEYVDQRVIEYFQTLPFTEHESQKSSMCASLVIAFKLHIDEYPPIIAVNGMYHPQPHCHRLYEEKKTGEEVGYDICRSKLCYQPEHSEVVAVRYLLEMLGFIDQENYHEIIIPGSIDAQHPLGLISITKLKRFIEANPKILERIASLKDRIRLSMYGHKICCSNCKDILTLLGLGDISIGVSQDTYKYERSERRLPVPDISDEVLETKVEMEL